MEECPNLPPNFAILPFEPLVVRMRQRMSRSLVAPGLKLWFAGCLASHLRQPALSQPPIGLADDRVEWGEVGHLTAQTRLPQAHVID